MDPVDQLVAATDLTAEGLYAMLDEVQSKTRDQESLLPAPEKPAEEAPGADALPGAELPGGEAAPAGKKG